MESSSPMAKLTLQLETIPGAEIVHHASRLGIVTSFKNRVRCDFPDGESISCALPQFGWKNLLLPFRLSRRLSRLDKCVAVPVDEGGHWKSLIVVRGGHCYHIDLESRAVVPTLTLRQSRNPLHQSICRSANGWFFQGEYGSNTSREPVPVYRSKDQGRSWHLVYELPAGKARHIHGCFWDPFEEKVWVCTGDFENENHVLVADENFEELEWLGDGSQAWRTCHLLFTEKFVVWGMDSQLETSYLCRLNRSTRKLEKTKPLPGPVWYAKKLDDAWLVVATVVEIGPGVHDDHAHVLVSRDGVDWQDVFQVKKDRWKMPLFKNGVINFADGAQSSDDFLISAEALVGIDGKVCRARLVGA
jgi:hypothetical protein